MSEEKAKKVKNLFIRSIGLTEAASHNKTADFAFGLGWIVKDVITSLKGTIVYRCDSITGCNQYGVLPRKGSETKHIDEHRLIWTGKIMELPIASEEVQKTPGGISGLAKKL